MVSDIRNENQTSHRTNPLEKGLPSEMPSAHLDNKFSTFAGNVNLILFHACPAVNPNQNQKHHIFSPVHYLLYIPFNNE